MLSALALVLLSQTQPAVRRSAPPADDPGMVVRNIPSGTQNVNVVGGGPLVPGSPDGGLIGTVIAIGPDGGAVPVQGSISATNPSVGPTASTVPAQATLVGGPDSSNLLRAPFVLTTTPDAGDPGLVVRVVGGISGGGGGGGSVTQGTVPWVVAGIDGGAVGVGGTVAVSSVGGTVTVTGTVTTSPPANASANVTQFGGSAVVTGTGVGGAGIPRVTVSSDSTVGVSGTVTVAGTVNAAQSGTWTVRNQDGVGNNLASSTSAPAGTEQGLIVRNIPSGTQTVTGTVTASGTVTANQGTPNTTANRWPVQLTDGTDLSQVSAAGALLVDGSATTQPVSGTVTANAGTGTFTVGQATPANLRAQTSSESNTAAAVPTQASMAGGSDGTNLRALRVATDGTVRVDPTGTTTQPVSGTVTANAGTGTFTVSGTVTANAGTNLNTSALALETTLGTRLADATFTGRINTLGQKTMAASTPVVIASDQSAVNVTPAPLADVTGAGTLNALNATCSVALTGRQGASFFVAAGTLAATSVAEVSPDNGTTWFPTVFVNQTTFENRASLVTTNPNAALLLTPYLPPGITNARLRVSAFTSGTAACTARASDNTPNLITPTTQVDGAVSSTGLVNVVGALDPADLPSNLRGSTSPTVNNAFGLAVRPVLKSAASVAAKNVSCGTSATSLTSSPLSNRQSVTFFNNGTNTVFIGPSGVTTTVGLPLLPGAYFQDDINSPQEYFCVVAAGTESVRVLEN